MAASLISGLLAAGHPKDCIAVCEPSAQRAKYLRGQYGVRVGATAQNIVEGASTVVLAVKPQQMGEALRHLRVDDGVTVLSIAAGVRLGVLRAALGEQVHCVRTMPNTPALYGCGISGLYAGPETPAIARQRAETVLKAAGEIVWLESERDLDAVTAVSGSGPAYFFLLVEAMREAGQELGLSTEISAKLAAQTCVGAARMIEKSSEDIAAMRANVTSKGGTTEAAIASLENAGWRPIISSALSAAAHRSAELGDAFDAASGNTPSD